MGENRKMEEAKQAIDRAFNDTSVEPEVSLDRGRELMEHLQDNITALVESFPELEGL